MKKVSLFLFYPLGVNNLCEFIKLCLSIIDRFIGRMIRPFFGKIEPEVIQEIEDQFREGIPHVSQNVRLAYYSGNSIFILRNEDGIVAYAVIEVCRFHKAILEFGPIIKTGIDSKDVFTHLREILRKNGIWYLIYQGDSADKNERLKKYFGKNLLLKEEKGWATAMKFLDITEEELFASFNENHKRNIKKAEKEGINPFTIRSENEFKNLIGIFHRMYQERKIHYYKINLENDLWALYNYIQETGKGFILGAQLNEQLLGGIIITFDGENGFYNFGASDRRSKKPVLHILFNHVFKELKLKGVKVLDLGGYDKDSKDPQFNALNKFKEGFGVEVVQYSPKLTLATSFVGGYFIDTSVRLRNVVLSAIGKHIS